MAQWRYDGFISYSRSVDRDLAATIQDGLERIAKPWNRRKALKVFRDIDDLAANPDLEGALRKELVASNTLIYLASPASAASPWCGVEVEYWIEERPPERLVVVLTDGTLEFDPSATPPIVMERSSAAPPAFEKLRSVPTYIDLRHRRDIDELDYRTNIDFRADLTKISAVLHTNRTGSTVEPRDIDSRDLAEFRKGRRYRRFAVTGLALLTVGMAIATILAITSAREADRQRAAAELEAATALARLGEASADVDLGDALASAAEGFELVRNDLTEWTLLKLLLESRQLEWATHVGDEVVTAAVPVADEAVFGTERGAVAAITDAVEIEMILPGRDVRVVDLTVDAAESVVAVAWADGSVAMIDVEQRKVVFESRWSGAPVAVAPHVNPSMPGVVVASNEAIALVNSEREVALEGASAGEGTRLRVLDDHLTYGAFFATEIDLVTGSSITAETGGNRGFVWDAAAGSAIWVDDRTRTIGVYAFDADVDFFFGSDRSVNFEREQVPIDDVTLSGDGSRIGVLSGSVIEVWRAGPVFDDIWDAERVVLVEGVARPGASSTALLELSHDGSTAITVVGTEIRRWDVGPDVIAPEVSLGGAVDALIAVDITNDAIHWEAFDGLGLAPARLDLDTYEWELIDPEAAPERTQVESDRTPRTSPDGSLSASVRNGVVTISRASDGTLLTTLRAGADEGYLAFTPDGRHLVQASRGGGLQVWPLVLSELCPALDRRVAPGTAQSTC